MADSEATITEQEMEHKIATRRQVQSLKELKSELSKQRDENAKHVSLLEEKELQVFMEDDDRSDQSSSRSFLNALFSLWLLDD